jgi:hypothetical protein
LIRIDRLAGAISSEPCNDFERVWRLDDDESSFSPSVIERSRSDSDSDDIPDEDEFDDSPLIDFDDPRLPNALLPLFGSPNKPALSALEMRTSSAAEARLPVPENEAPNFRSCEKGANVPLSSHRHAIKYTPGAANVEKIQRIESMRTKDILFGMMSHPVLSEPNC